MEYHRCYYNYTLNCRSAAVGNIFFSSTWFANQVLKSSEVPNSDLPLLYHWPLYTVLLSLCKNNVAEKIYAWSSNRKGS